MADARVPDRVPLFFHACAGGDLQVVREMLALDPAFDEDLYEPFYGGRQFSVRDPNGCSLIFYQPE